MPFWNFAAKAVLPPVHARAKVSTHPLSRPKPKPKTKLKAKPKAKPKLKPIVKVAAKPGFPDLSKLDFSQTNFAAAKAQADANIAAKAAASSPIETPDPAATDAWGRAPSDGGGGGGGGGGSSDDGGGDDDSGAPDDPSPLATPDPTATDAWGRPPADDSGSDDADGGDDGDDADDSDAGDDDSDDDSTSGEDPMPGSPYHVARGALPSHEAGLDCRLRLWREGTNICGVARCDTSYGPVVLQARADARVVGRLFEKLQAGAPAPQAVASALRDTEKAVRSNLLEQAAEVPTSSAHPVVATAGKLVDDLRRRSPAAVGCLRQLAAREQNGDPKAAAGMAVVKSVAQTGAAKFGCSGFPGYHRPSVSVSGAPAQLTAAQHDHIKTVLINAVAAAHPAVVAAKAAAKTAAPDFLNMQGLAQALAAARAKAAPKKVIALKLKK